MHPIKKIKKQMGRPPSAAAPELVLGCGSCCNCGLGCNWLWLRLWLWLLLWLKLRPWLWLWLQLWSWLWPWPWLWLSRYAGTVQYLRVLRTIMNIAYTKTLTMTHAAARRTPREISGT